MASYYKQREKVAATYPLPLTKLHILNLPLVTHGQVCVKTIIGRNCILIVLLWMLLSLKKRCRPCGDKCFPSLWHIAQKSFGPKPPVVFSFLLYGKWSHINNVFINTLLFFLSSKKPLLHLWWYFPSTGMKYEVTSIILSSIFFTPFFFFRNPSYMCIHHNAKMCPPTSNNFF